MIVADCGGSRAARAVGESPTPSTLARGPCLPARLHPVKRARIDVVHDSRAQVVVVATTAARPATAAVPPPPPPPPPLTAAAHATGPLPDPALQRAVNACATWRDCAALLKSPLAPRLDAMLVCALATRAAHLVAASDDEGEDAAASAAFIASLASAALERASSSRPQQFAQVTVSLARLVARRRESARNGNAADDANANADPSLRPWLERYLSAAEVHLPRFSERRLCQLAWGAAKLWTAAAEEEESDKEQPQPVPPLLPAGERWWGALLAEAQDRLPTLRDGRDWSNMLWALARLGVAVPPGWADDALAALTRRVVVAADADADANNNSSSSPAPPILAAMRPRERATALWALARMGVQPPPDWVERELGPALLRRLSPNERRAERARRAERRERPWARRGVLVGEVMEEEEGDAGEEPESARDVAVTLWALARWQQQEPQPALAAAASAALAARAADALDRELPLLSSSSSSSSSASSTSHSLVVALASLARLPPTGALLGQEHQQPCWLSLARRALPSLSGGGLARLVRALAALRPGRSHSPPTPEWMRALQLRALQLASQARIRAGELAAVLRFFAAERWFPGAAWWAGLLAATERTGLMRIAPVREVLALAGAVRAALGVGGKAVARRRRRRTRRAEGGDEGGEPEGLLASVLLLDGGRKGRHRPAVARWAQALWERVVEASEEEGEAEVGAALAGVARALAPAPARLTAATAAAS